MLSAFSPAERETLAETAKTVSEALALMVKDQTDLAMNRYNTGKQKKPKAPKSDAAGQQNEEGGSCT